MVQEPKKIQDLAEANIKFPPGPEGQEWWDLYAKEPLDAFIEAQRNYGDLVHFAMGAKRHMYLTTNPDHFQYILFDHAEQFHQGTLFKRRMGKLLGNGLVTSEGEFYRQQRRLIQPAFAHNRFSSYAEIIVNEARATLDSWRSGETRDIHKEMANLTINIVIKALFGTDTHVDTESVGKAIGTCFQYLNYENLPAPTESLDYLNSVLTEIIDKRRENPHDTGDLLSILLMSHDDNNIGMTDKQIRDEAMTLFIAGHESSSNALSWTLYLLSQYPEVITKLNSEIQSVLSDREPSFSDLARLDYTELVIKEALRIYPPAWIAMRTALEDVELDKYIIPKGSMIFLCTYIVHQNAQYHSNPEQFIPERFSDDYEKKIPKGAYLPFLIGPRTCIGQHFAMMEMKLILAMIVQKYQVTSIDSNPVKPDPLVSLRPRNGLKMNILSYQPEKR